MKKHKLIEILKHMTGEQRAKFRERNADKTGALACLDEVEAIEKRSAPQPQRQPVPEPFEKAEDRFIKMAVKGNADAAKTAAEQRATKRADAEQRLESALMAWAVEKKLDYAKERPRVLVNALGTSGSLEIRKLYEAVHYPDETPDGTLPTIDVVGAITKADVEPLQKRIVELTTERDERVADYAARHDLTLEKARVKLTAARSYAHANGETHWLDRWDGEIEKCQESIAEKRGEASQRVYELTMKAVQATDTEAEERKRLELIAAEHPIEKAFRALVMKYQADHGLAAYEHALYRSVNDDPAIRQLFEARKHVTPTPEMIAAGARLADLDNKRI